MKTNHTISSLLISLMMLGIASAGTRFGNISSNQKLAWGPPGYFLPTPNKLSLQGVVVVKLKPSVIPSVARLMKVPEIESRILGEASLQSIQSVAHILGVRIDSAAKVLSDIYIIKYTGAVVPDMVAEALKKNPDIVYAEPHYIYRVSDQAFVPNDSLLSFQYALSKIEAFKAWDTTLGDSTVVVGVVDTGVYWMHPDLYPNIWHNPNWRNDTNYPADSIGWDFGGTTGTPDNDPEEDGPHHGTHVAGIIAAVANNYIGIAGVAPKVKLMVVKVSQGNMVDQNGEPYIVYGYEGIAYAANHGARIINCSWGGVGYSQFEQDVINYATSKGALVVAAAGNDYHSNEFQTPAYYQNVLSVAATDQNDYATAFTNMSYNISVSAPGKDIISTWDKNSYTYLSGTSMASPCAAGVAALVASLHPDYTPQQILEQVRVSSDNIDSQNPSYTHLIGYGRVNAYNAITVSSPGISITNIAMSDSVGGNGDGQFTEGEVVQVFAILQNWLSPASNVQVNLTTTDQYVTIINGSVSIGAMGKMANYNLRQNPLSFKVNSGTPPGHLVTFLITVTSGSYSDYAGVQVMLKPLFSQLTENNIFTTVAAKGNIGFNDYPNNTQGIGFVYLPDRDSILFEGAFMAGISASNEVDVARDQTGNQESADFTPEGLVKVLTPGKKADQESISAFNDSAATTNRVGIETTLHTYAYAADTLSNFIVLEYKIRNLNSYPLNNFYAGLFFDWDIGPNGSNNIAAYDAKYQLGYAYNVTRSPRTYAGVALLSGGGMNYTAINNADSINGIYGGFTKIHKWQALSGGTKNNYAGPSDVSMVVGAGPIVIPADSDTTVVFALVAGDTLSDLEKAVEGASAAYYGLITGEKSRPVPPESYALLQNYPNPFNPDTRIIFELPVESKVKVTVYNIAGQEISTLINADLVAGEYSLNFNGSHLPSGIYFYRLIATGKNGTFTQVRKMALIK
ncbi:MAG: S8 family peptidase [Candidatus Kryptoniota bacterium]